MTASSRSHDCTFYIHTGCSSCLQCPSDLWHLIVLCNACPQHSSSNTHLSIAMTHLSPPPIYLFGPLISSHVTVTWPMWSWDYDGNRTARLSNQIIWHYTLAIEIPVPNAVIIQDYLYFLTVLMKILKTKRPKIEPCEFHLIFQFNEEPLRNILWAWFLRHYIINVVIQFTNPVYCYGVYCKVVDWIQMH